MGLMNNKFELIISSNKLANIRSSIPKIYTELKKIDHEIFCFDFLIQFLVINTFK